MAVVGNKGCRWVRSDFGGTTQPPVVKRYVKGSQTIYRGTVLRCSATSGHGSVGVAAEADTTLFGYANEAKTTTATQLTAMITVIPFVSGHVYSFLGAPSTMTGKGRAYLNSYADLEIPTASYSRLDTGGTIKAFRIVGWNPRTEATTGAGREWYVQILPSAANYNVAQET